MASLDTLYKKPETRGDIKVKKVFTAPLSDLYVEDGFNIRHGEITVESVQGLITAYMTGEPIPPIVVSVQPDSRLKIIAGHRRFTALTHIVNTLGQTEFERVELRSINSDDVGTIKYMVGENSGKNLNAVDMALACGKLRDLGLTPAQIAEELSFSESKVNYHLTIDKMSDDVKQLIIDGKIAADLAAERFRKAGDKAVVDLVEGNTSEKKVTRANAGLWRPSMGKSIVNMLGTVKAQVHNDEVNVTMSVDEWNEIQEAVKALNKE